MPNNIKDSNLPEIIHEGEIKKILEKGAVIICKKRVVFYDEGFYKVAELRRLLPKLSLKNTLSISKDVRAVYPVLFEKENL